jgi:hypothetical protein
MMRGSVVRPTVNRDGGKELTAGLDQSAAWSRRALYVIFAGATDHENICRIKQSRTLPLQK